MTVRSAARYAVFGRSLAVCCPIFNCRHCAFQVALVDASLGLLGLCHLAICWVEARGSVDVERTKTWKGCLLLFRSYVLTHTNLPRSKMGRLSCELFCF